MQAFIRGEGDSLIKVGTDVRARASGFSGINFCLGIRLWKVSFAQALGFRQLLTKKCVIDKRVKKMAHLHYKVRENFLEKFCPA